MNFKKFPFEDQADTNEKKAEDIAKNSPGTYVFGHRFFNGQSLYEYLIEFLLIFISSKNYTDGVYSGEMKFHDLNSRQLVYYANKNMGLKRFIFYEKSLKGKSIAADKEAYQRICDLVTEKMRQNDEDDDTVREIVGGIQDLLRGYAVAIKNRTWCATAVLPICPELIFPEAMPNVQKRLDEYQSGIKEGKHFLPKIDTEFSFDKRQFLARGGEVYYLHLLQSLNEDPEKKQKLEQLLTYMLEDQTEPLNKTCTTIEKIWEKDLYREDETKFQEEMRQTLSLAYIPANAYTSISSFAVDELINYLSADVDPITRIEVLGEGVFFQIMRMMTTAVASYLNRNTLPWIIDMRGKNNNKGLRCYAAQAYESLRLSFKEALSLSEDNLLNEQRENGAGDKITEKKRIGNLKKAMENSFGIFQNKGKEIGCIVPPNGRYTRMTLSEDIVRFLVLSLVKPKTKMMLDEFLARLYKHYNIIIGPKEFHDYCSKNEEADQQESLSGEFSSNLEQFRNFLKSVGFLLELSDATSLVVNPYDEVELSK